MRYFKLYRAFVANCLSRAMEFRGQFFAGLFGYALWAGVSLLFIEAVFGSVGAVRGWTRPQMWVLYGSFVTLESLIYGLLGPNMWRFSTMVQDGGLDLVLTKPVNAQFFVSLRYIDLNGVLNCVPGLALLIYGLRAVGHTPTASAWLLWLLLLACALVMVYAFWFFVVTWSIWFVKMEGVAVLIDPMLQAARFPLEIYPARVQGLLTGVLPIAFLTTFPAQALLGRAQPLIGIYALLLAGVLLTLNRAFFKFALRFYGSASS